MKKIFQTIAVSFILSLLSPCITHAATNPDYITPVIDEHGYYIETIITEATPNNQSSSIYAASNSITRTKTTYMGNQKFIEQ